MQVLRHPHRPWVHTNALKSGGVTLPPLPSEGTEAQPKRPQRLQTLGALCLGSHGQLVWPSQSAWRYPSHPSS